MTRTRKKRILSPEQKEKIRKSNYERRRFRKSDPKLFGITEYAALKARAASKSRTGRNMEFDLTPEYIQDLFDKSNGCCAITGISFDMELGKHRNRNPYRPSVDRIDSTKGYIKDNIQIVLSIVNTLRLDYSNDVIHTVIKEWNKHI